MHKSMLIAAVLSAAAFAGPTLACHQWVSTPGSAFEALEPLRDAAMSAANHPEQRESARKKLAELRQGIRPGDAVSLLKAGYWAAILNSLHIVPDTDGPAMIAKAAELRPDDAEYQFFAGLAYFDTDKELYRQHWARAEALAHRGSATAQNLKSFTVELAARTR
jgi:hypothetical protein